MYVREESVEGADRDELIQAWKVVKPHLQDGEMDPVSLQLLAAEVGVALSAQEARDAVVEMDKDDSGTINRQEFFQWWDSSGKSNVGRLLTSVINRQRENTRYLPGIKLGDNVRAISSIPEAVANADVLVFVTPHQFIRDVCAQLKGNIKPTCRAISLIKGEHDPVPKWVVACCRRLSLILTLTVALHLIVDPNAKGWRSTKQVSTPSQL